MRFFPVLAALVALAPGAAHAADGEVHASFGLVPVFLQGDAAAVVECNAIADPNGSLDVPVATSVWCSVAGNPKAAVAPGAVVATGDVVVFERTFEICWSGTATYLDVTTNEIYRVKETHPCATIEL